MARQLPGSDRPGVAVYPLGAGAALLGDRPAVEADRVELGTVDRLAPDLVVSTGLPDGPGTPDPTAIDEPAVVDGRDPFDPRVVPHAVDPPGRG